MCRKREMEGSAFSHLCLHLQLGSVMGPEACEEGDAAGSQGTGTAAETRPGTCRMCPALCLGVPTDSAGTGSSRTIIPFQRPGGDWLEAHS